MSVEMYNQLVTYVMAGLIGLCVGSFLNVLIYRLPNHINLAKPASHCPQCKHSIRWYDNIPVLSYLMLGGKCRNCKKHIPVRYTLVELFNMLLWLASVYAFFEEGWLSMATKALILSCLLTVFFTDLEYMVIPQTMQIALLILAISLFFSGDPHTWRERLIGLLIGGGGFFAVYLIAYVFYQKEALGFGDVKLMALLGVILGGKSVFFAILAASLVASVVLTVLNRTKKNGKGHEYPLAPFLTTAGAIALFFGDRIVNGYFHFFRML